MKVLLVKRRGLERDNVVRALKNYKQIEIVAVVDDEKEFFKFLNEKNPEIILLEPHSVEDKIISIIERARDENARVKIIVTDVGFEKAVILNLLKRGVYGFCPKKSDVADFVSTIRVVSKDGVCINPGVLDYILRNVVINESSQICEFNFNLSMREIEILKLVANGHSNEKISNILVISLYTVKNHVSSIIKKLSVKDRTQAALFAVKNGLL